MAKKPSSEANKPSPEAAQYGAALDRLVEPYRSSLTGKYLAQQLEVSESKVSRFFSGKNRGIASKDELNRIIKLVEEAAARRVPGEVARELHRLRERAQAAARTPSKEVDRLEGEVQQLSAELRESVDRAEELQLQVEQGEAVRAAEIAAYKSALDVGSSQLAGLRKQLARAEAAQGQLNAAARKDQTEITTLRAALEQAEAAGRAKVADINDALAAREAGVRALRDELEAAETANAQLRREAATLMQELRRAEEQTAHWRHTAEQAEVRAQQTISELRKQLQAAAEYGRDSDALIEEQLRLLAERESDNQRLRSEVRALSRQVRSYAEAEERTRSWEVIAGDATQVTAGTAAPESTHAGGAAPRPPRSPDPRAAAPKTRQPSSGEWEDDDSWALRPDDGVNVTQPVVHATSIDVVEEDNESHPTPIAFRIGLIWDGIVSLATAQMVSFFILAFRVMAASGKTPHSRDIICWGGAIVLSLGILWLGYLFSVSDMIAKALPVFLLVCALTAGFGSTVFTIPAVSNLAHSVGVEMAERADGKSCDISFCQTG